MKVSKIPYRPDIDGLRAVAVLSVIAFHFGLLRFARGGFIGVDIFFVISGYLITQIIAPQIQGGTFSIAGFYRRRALRILPAFFAMMIGALIGSLILLPPIEVAEFGRSAFAASFSASNFFFYFSPSGYFFDDLNARPLLHTWSLGVEEQFYALFPLLLIAAHRWARDRLRWAIIATGVISLCISLWSLRHDPDGAFYLLPSRFWELMLGAAAAIGILPEPRGTASRELVSLAGAAMMAFAIVTTDGQYLPYYWAILPCAGAVMVIQAGGKTWVGRVLSLKPIVAIGLISYSLYLWHWPVFVFDHVALLRALTNSERAIIAAISFALAVASYFLVERPFRRLRRAIPNWQVLIPAGVSMLGASIIGLILVDSAGFPARFSTKADAVSAYLDPRAPDRFRSGVCFISKPNEHLDWNKCLGPDDGVPRTILFGDSHAAALYSAFKGAPWLRQVTTTYCRPLIGLDLNGLPFCSDIVETFFARYLKAQHPHDTVILAERWQDGEEAATRKTIEAFRKTGARVVLIGPNPEYLAPLPRLQFASLTWRRPPNLKAYLNSNVPSLDRQFALVASEGGAAYISASQILGASGPDTLILSDTDHLTPAAAALIVQHCMPFVSNTQDNH